MKLLLELTSLSLSSLLCFLKESIQHRRAVDNQMFRYFVNMLLSVQMFRKHLVFDNFVYSHNCLVLHRQRYPLNLNNPIIFRAVDFILHAGTHSKKYILYHDLLYLCKFTPISIFPHIQVCNWKNSFTK